jgi:hypothetical protein
MSTRPTNPQYHPGDRISERAARGAIAHFRAAGAEGARRAKGARRAAPDPANAIVSDRRDIRRSATDPQILRRWVISDLIADASRRRAFA